MICQVCTCRMTLVGSLLRTLLLRAYTYIHTFIHSLERSLKCASKIGVEATVLSDRKRGRMTALAPSQDALHQLKALEVAVL